MIYLTFIYGVRRDITSFFVRLGINCHCTSSFINIEKNSAGILYLFN